MILSLALTACGGSSDSSDSSMDESGYESSESMDEIVFSTYSGDLLVECAEGWTCTEEYGGSITHEETYNGLMFYDVYGTDLESLLDLNVEQILAVGNREVIDTYDWKDGAMASVIEDLDNGQHFWISVFDAGFADSMLKCQANFAADTYEGMVADIELMCGSATVQ